ncbi:unnamed protein product [Rhizoctonia solani]|uniref:Zn(2)-C6 fungal-type domain-containing protein n=1 Tax=Rhizoctonia solani TaxID=456999 RepID=A0A8H2XUR9_9AGAM|nr:unnamed protein product [Rhizoctonia solani]
MPPRIPPGPAGTSCLTCKQRHKRCDGGQPQCERCIKGGYECLGYGHIRRAATNPKSRGVRVQRPVPTEQDKRNTAPPADPNSSVANVSSSSPDISSVEAHCETLDHAVSSSSSLNNSLDVDHNGQIANRLNKSALALAPTRSTNHGQPASNPIAPGDSRVAPLPHQLFAFSTRMPYSPFSEPKVFFQSITFEDYVIAHGEMMMERSYFKPIPNQTERLKQTTLTRLQRSSFTRWILFLCARICESFAQGDISQNQIYNRWIGDVERALKSALTQNLGPREAQERLGDTLEVQLLKAMMGHCSGTYQLLRTVTPTFLQTVFSDPDLWSDSHDPTLVPLGSIIGSTHHGLAHFALTDSLSAMAFGLPSHVDYDTIGYTPESTPVPFEWHGCHGSPAEFQILLADINACRDKRSSARAREDIEQQLLAWQVKQNYYFETWEPWMISAWSAVQESWRLALLAYLYMAVFERSSDDAQVQLCTQQIFEVISTVKQHEPSKASIPFFIQYLIAGICASSSCQRALVREQLATVSMMRLWLMRGRDFVPVLEHLWQGAAAEGNPIKWRDYLDSREAVLPVVS